MKNRAKCNLCKDIIESFHSTDYVSCSCGAIFVDGGDSLKCGATDWKHFLRIDDEGKEKPVQLKKESDVKPLDIEAEKKPDYIELMKLLDGMIENIEKLPQNAMFAPATHSDICSALIVVREFFKLLKTDSKTTSDLQN